MGVHLAQVIYRMVDAMVNQEQLAIRDIGNDKYNIKITPLIYRSVIGLPYRIEPVSTDDVQAEMDLIAIGTEIQSIVRSSEGHLGKWHNICDQKDFMLLEFLVLVPSAFSFYLELLRNNRGFPVVDARSFIEESFKRSFINTTEKLENWSQQTAKTVKDREVKYAEAGLKKLLKVFQRVNPDVVEVQWPQAIKKILDDFARAGDPRVFIKQVDSYSEESAEEKMKKESFFNLIQEYFSKTNKFGRLQDFDDNKEVFNEISGRG